MSEDRAAPEMVERVARAILAKVPIGYGMTKTESIEYARAAIEAMREPIAEIFESVGTQFQSPHQTSPSVAHDARVYWRAVIDAALQ